MSDEEIAALTKAIRQMLIENARLPWPTYTYMAERVVELMELENQ